MFTLSLEPTNACNRDCLHCVRNKIDPSEMISLELVEKVLSQAKTLGIKEINLTGGEITLYPRLAELLGMIAGYGFNFGMVSNGFAFKETLLPILTDRSVSRHFNGISFSLDGACRETHDAMRGEGSFKEVMEAATVCKIKGLRTSLKSAITNFSKTELTELALLGATLGVDAHGFLCLFPTPALIEKDVLPSPAETDSIARWVMGSLAKTVRTHIIVEGYSTNAAIFICGNVISGANVDYQGNLTFCCNLSHVTNGPSPTKFGAELLADLRKEPLAVGIARHFKMLAHLVEARLKDADKLSAVELNPCYWCMKRLGKLDWLKDYPDSPWAEGLLSKCPTK